MEGIKIDTFLFSFFSIAYIGILVIGVICFRTYKLKSVVFLLPVVVGLIYDNGIIAIGQFIGEGLRLERLNLARFWIHAFFTPLLVLFSWKTLEQGEVLWVKKPLSKFSAYALTLSLVLFELFTEVLGLHLVANMENGVLSYSSVEPSTGPPLMVLVVSLVLLVASIIIWRKQKWKWFFAGSLAMIIGSAVSLPIDSGAITNFFELGLITSLLGTAIFQSKNITKDSH
jgi:lipoprotein signal peptidase